MFSRVRRCPLRWLEVPAKDLRAVSLRGEIAEETRAATAMIEAVAPNPCGVRSSSTSTWKSSAFADLQSIQAGSTRHAGSASAKSGRTSAAAREEVPDEVATGCRGTAHEENRHSAEGDDHRPLEQEVRDWKQHSFHHQFLPPAPVRPAPERRGPAHARTLDRPRLPHRPRLRLHMFELFLLCCLIGQA